MVSMVEMRFRNRFTVLLLLILVTVTLLPYSALGDQDGKGDGDYSCTGCHKSGGSATIAISAVPASLEAGQAGNVVVTVNADAINDDNYIVGVMLLTGSNDNVDEDGWSITADPNGNGSPYNYVEKAGVSGDTDFTWTLAAPESAGTYDIKTRIIFGGDDANFVDSDASTVTVTGSTGTDDEVTEDEGVNLDALKLGILAGLMGVVAVLILRKRW